MKKCCDCKKSKPLSQFWLHKTRGHQPTCKTCGKKRMKKYRKTPQHIAYNRDRWLNRSLPQKLCIFRRSDPHSKDPLLTPENFRTKVGVNPICYLTGKPINLDNWNEYSLDHIIPVAKGGKSTLENCGLTTRQANSAKTDLFVAEFLELCQQVVKQRIRQNDFPKV